MPARPTASMHTPITLSYRPPARIELALIRKKNKKSAPHGIRTRALGHSRSYADDIPTRPSPLCWAGGAHLRLKSRPANIAVPRTTTLPKRAPEFNAKSPPTDALLNLTEKFLAHIKLQSSTDIPPSQITPLKSIITEFSLYSKYPLCNGFR